MTQFFMKCLDENDVELFYEGEHQIFGNYEGWSLKNCRYEITNPDRYYIGIYAYNLCGKSSEKNILEKDDSVSDNPKIDFVEIVDFGKININDFECCGLVAWGGITTFNDSDLMTIAVIDKFRGMGFAKIILEKLIEKAKDLKLRAIFLEVRESNISAIKLYEKYGFSKISLRKNYYKSPLENAVIMKMPINDIGVIGAEII